MWAALGIGALLLAAFILRALTGLGGSSTEEGFATWVSDAIGFCAFLVCLWRAVRTPDDRRLWGFAAAGIAAWVLGNAYWEHSLAAGVSLPNPSPADIGFLAFYPLMYLAVLAARSQDRASRAAVGVWLDGLIGASACAMLAAALVLQPVVDATAGESVAGAMTNLAYPIGDVTLLAMLVVTSATVGWRRSPGLAGLAAGMAIFAVGDCLYIVENANGTYQGGGVLDASWLLALICMAGGAASLAVAPRRPERRRGGRHAIVPIVAGSAALAVLTSDVYFDLPTTGMVLATLTLGLVVLRLAVSLRETSSLLAVRAREAVRDPLTGLANRRKLLSDLERSAGDATDEEPLLLVLFDLDGFKTYNDTFGHNAGDELLIQVSTGLREALGGRGEAYRMGGDEFCALLVARDHESVEEIGEELAAAMARHGRGFSVTASHGVALSPRDGRETTELIRKADDEMYARKGRSRPGTDRQVQDALTAVLGARDPEMESHASIVAEQATVLGERIGIEGAELRTLVHAAALHDIGKIAIPDMLLEKAEALDTDERRFLRTHPLIAERIVSAAPALGYAGHIVRSVQERWDGSGYPDGLSGDTIPPAARVIAICNAYQAMTSRRPNREALTREQAFEQLRAGAGTQFDPALVEPMIELVEEPGDRRRALRQASRRRPEALAPRRGGLEARLDYQADHDILTGLLNRRRFAEELDRSLRYAARYRRGGALLVFDVDNLKLVNDLHGHAVGDIALGMVATEIAGRIRSSDLAARLGGDEFAIVLHEADEEDALSVAADIRARLAESDIDPPVQLSGGVVVFEGEEELVSDDLMTAADVALFEAKEAGRNETRVYRDGAGSALRWVQRIREALEEERFVLYGQPIADLKSGEIRHSELLLRMRSEAEDLIPPQAFIPTAERFGLVNRLDRWVAGQGLRLAEGGEGVTINLSAHSIGDPKILDRVRRAREAGVPKGAVIFEITETAAMSNMQEARRFIERLNELGCDVALDDFGTGFGSFSYLKHLPSRYLKIDVEFVRDVATNETDQRVVRSIVDIGHSLGKRIVAEGVEDAAAERTLRRYGVDFIQGLHVGPPERIAARVEATRTG